MAAMRWLSAQYRKTFSTHYVMAYPSSASPQCVPRVSCDRRPSASIENTGRSPHNRPEANLRSPRAVTGSVAGEACLARILSSVQEFDRGAKYAPIGLGVATGLSHVTGEPSWATSIPLSKNRNGFSCKRVAGAVRRISTWYDEYPRGRLGALVHESRCPCHAG